MAKKPIRVFYSILSERFYATDSYREDEGGRVIVITGRKFDVTNDIGAAIERENITFEREEQK